MPDQTIYELDPDRIKVFVHRERDPAAHERAIADTRRRGQIEPGEVRDIRHLPKEERRRPEGGFYDFGLIVGQGRLLRAKALGQKFKAFIVDRKELDVVGRFLSENLNRVALPWVQKARLIQPRLQAGESVEEIAEALSLTVGHINKFKRIVDKTAAGLEDEVAGMAVNDAEVFTALPANHQAIVMEAFHETKEGSIRELVKVAKRISEETGGELSSTALRKSLERLNTDLQRMRDRLKLTRLHHSLGPQNLSVLLRDRKFRAALEREVVNVAKFEKVTES